MNFLSVRGQQRALISALVLGCSMGPLLAQPAEPIFIIPEQGRRIADPENLAPPRPATAPGSSHLAAPDAPPVSLDMNSTITTVLQRSPTLERVLSRIRQAEYRVDEAYSLANPTVSFDTQYSRVEPGVAHPSLGQISPANNYQFSLTIRQAIYTFGRLKWNALAAKLQKRVVEEDYRTEVNRLVQLTAQRYIEALLSQDAVTIAQDNLEAQQANLRTSQLLFEQGVAARFDVLSNSAAVARAQQRLIEARTSEANAKARVLSLLDEPLNRSLELASLDLFAPVEIALADAKERALESRPDLRSTRWAVEEARARVEVAETSNNPTLALQNTSVNRNAAGFTPETQNTTAIVLSVPLFDGGVSKLQAEQAKEVFTQLSRDLEQGERDVVLQVEEVHNQLLDRWLAISVAGENVAQAEEALRVALLRYQNGISTNTELLDAQANRSQARFDLAQARANYLQSRWTWWQVTASEYPAEVPFPAYVRERMDAEGLPLRPATQEFSEEPTGEPIGPLLPTQPSPRIPIRGLPGQDEPGITPATEPGQPLTPGSASPPDVTLPRSDPGSSGTISRPAGPADVRPGVPPIDTVLPSTYPDHTTVRPVPSGQPGTHLLPDLRAALLSRPRQGREWALNLVRQRGCAWPPGVVVGDPLIITAERQQLQFGEGRSLQLNS